MKHNKLKRALALLLCLMMVISNLPGSVISTQATSSDTSTETQDENDILSIAAFEYSTSVWNDGNGLTWNSASTETYGEGSTRSWGFSASSAITTDTTFQMKLNSTYDFNDCYFVFEGKLVSDTATTQTIGARLHGGSSGWKDVCGTQSVTLTNEWQTFTMDFSNLLWKNTETEEEGDLFDLSNIQLITWSFSFDDNAGDRAFYIDNARIVKKETVSEDWINMSIDAGDSKVESYTVTDEKVKAEGSTLSMKIQTGSGECTWTLHTENAVALGQLSAIPNMTEGFIGGYFYFSDAEPSVKIRLTDYNWHGGVTLSMNMLDAGDGWYYGYIDVSELYFYADQIAAGATAEQIRRVKLTFPANATVYVDGLLFPTQIPEGLEPETTEPEATEPEATEPETTVPVDEGDLLGTVNAISYNKSHWDNYEGTDTGLTVQPDAENTYGDTSIRSWSFTADADAAVTSATAQFHLGQSWDMTGKNLAFDIKYVADTRQQQSIGIRLHVASWGNINDTNKVIKLNPGDEWKTFVVDFSDVLNDGRDFSDLSLISFYFDFSSNTGVERTVYIDNVRLVDEEQTPLVEDPLPEPQDENDLLADTDNISYDRTHWENVENGDSDSDGTTDEDVTTGLTCGTDTVNIYGEGSLRSWYFKAAAGASYSSATAQLMLGQSYDMRGFALAMDVKFDCADPDAVQTFSVMLHHSGWTEVTSPRAVRVGTGKWTSVVLDMTELLVSGSDLSDVKFITFSFDFSANTELERTVYIENVRLVSSENLSADWSGMTFDTGSNLTTAELFYATADKVHGSSTQSLKIVTGDTAEVLCLHAENAVLKGRLDDYLDLSSCVIGGYFYFGDQTPEATLSVMDYSWLKSRPAHFTFVDAGDGWYFGYVPSSALFYEVSSSGQTGDSSVIRRLFLEIPAGYTVYIDDLNSTYVDPSPLDPNDLLGDLHYIVYDETHWGAETGLTYGRDTDNIYGSTSTRSWSFHAAADAANPEATAQFRLSEAHDMTDAKLILDVKYVHAGEESSVLPLGVRVHNTAWSDLSDHQYTADIQEGVWTTVVIDLTTLIKEDADTTDLRFISFFFDFETTTGAERSIYIDNVRLASAETVRDDWTNMSQDTGSFYCNVSTNITTDVFYAEGSSQSLYVTYDPAVETQVSGKTRVTFSPQAAVSKGTIDRLPDSSSGVLGAWFYFPNGNPSASVVLTEEGWKGSNSVAFTFTGDGKDGWYYGTVDFSTVVFPETEEPGAVIRIAIDLPENYVGYIDGMTYTPQAPAELKFASAHLALHHKLSVTFRVDSALFGEGMFEDPYVTFQFNGSTVTVTEYTVVNGRYSFTLHDIAPTQINDTMLVTVYGTYKGTVFEGETREYSVAAYCYNMLAKCTGEEYTQFRALLVDVLNYGAAAQVYAGYRTDDLANAKLTAEQLAMGTTEYPELRDMMDASYETIENPTVTWMGAGLVLTESVGIRYKFQAESTDGLTVKITAPSGEEWTVSEFTPVPGTQDQFYAYFNELNASQIRKVLYATVYQGDTAVSNTARYSIEAYAYAMIDDTQCGALVKALVCYCFSALAYIN